MCLMFLKNIFEKIQLDNRTQAVAFYNQLQKWTGIKKSFHCTRHTFATRCVEKGWTIQEISAQGGWRDLRVLKRYTHLSANHLAKKLGS